LGINWVRPPPPPPVISKRIGAASRQAPATADDRVAAAAAERVRLQNEAKARQTAAAAAAAAERLKIEEVRKTKERLEQVAKERRAREEAENERTRVRMEEQAQHKAADDQARQRVAAMFPNLMSQSASTQQSAGAQPQQARDSLPEGWAAVIDTKTGRTYYFNAATRKTQWDKPRADPSTSTTSRTNAATTATTTNDWAANLQRRQQAATAAAAASRDTADAAAIIANRAERRRAAEKQRAEQQQRELEEQQRSSRVRFASSPAAGSQPQQASDALPEGWAAVVDPKTGRAYYVNAATRKTQWDRPRGEDRQQQQRSLDRFRRAEGSAATSNRSSRPDVDFGRQSALEIGGSAAPKGLMPHELAEAIDSELRHNAARREQAVTAGVKEALAARKTAGLGRYREEESRREEEEWNFKTAQELSLFDDTITRTALPVSWSGSSAWIRPELVPRVYAHGPANAPPPPTGPHPSGHNAELVQGVSGTAMGPSIGLLGQRIGSSCRVGVATLEEKKFVFLATKSSFNVSEYMLSVTEGARYVLVTTADVSNTRFWLMRPEVGGEAKWVNPKGLMKSVDSRYTEDGVVRVKPTGPLRQPREIFALRHNDAAPVRDRARVEHGPGPAAPRAQVIGHSLNCSVTHLAHFTHSVTHSLTHAPHLTQRTSLTSLTSIAHSLCLLTHSSHLTHTLTLLTH
jgi:hypothetical protein